MKLHSRAYSSFVVKRNDPLLESCQFFLPIPLLLNLVLPVTERCIRFVILILSVVGIGVDIRHLREVSAEPLSSTDCSRIDTYRQ